MTKEELEKEATEYAQKLGAKDFIAKPKEIVAYFGYLAAAEPREKRIAELEKACEETQELLDKQIEATYRLDKENAELKEINTHTLSQLNLENGELITELTKAKELLKQWVELYKPKLEGYPITPIQEQTEQFLKEVEK